MNKTYQFNLLCIALCFFVIGFWGCKKEADPEIHVIWQQDPFQERLDNEGRPSPVSSSNLSLSPKLNTIAVEHIELLAANPTRLFSGATLFSANNKQTVNDTTVSLDKLVFTPQSTPLSTSYLKPLQGKTFEWICVWVAYQSFDVRFNLNNVPNIGTITDENGTFNTFLAANTFISKHKVITKEDIVNDYRPQGYWLFETNLRAAFSAYNSFYRGQLAPRSVTAVNPLAASLATPRHSNIFITRLDKPITITGEEKNNVTITLTFSTNQAFEWRDNNRNGRWDIDVQNIQNEPIMNFGLRGMKAVVTGL
jgi:hypothetical protein